jgi:hypothetical protein
MEDLFSFTSNILMSAARLRQIPVIAEKIKPKQASTLISEHWKNQSGKLLP